MIKHLTNTQERVLSRIEEHKPQPDFKSLLAQWAKDKNIIIGHDLAYSDMVFRGKRAHSMLEVKGARKFSIEFHCITIYSFCQSVFDILTL